MVTPADILKGGLLVVDHQEQTARSIAEMLSEAGYGAVTFTTNPSEMGELHRKNRYDLILLDLEMPEVNGFHVMEELRAIETAAYPAVRPRRGAGAHTQHARSAPVARGSPKYRNSPRIHGAP